MGFVRNVRAPAPYLLCFGLVGYGGEISLITVSGNSTRSLSLPTELLLARGVAIYSSINPSPRTSSSEIIQQSLACPCSYSFFPPYDQRAFARMVYCFHDAGGGSHGLPVGILVEKRPHE